MKFNLEKHIAKSVASMAGYAPGEQPKTTGWVKLNTNEFPYPPSPKVIKAISAELGKNAESLRLYPDPISAKLRVQVEKYFGLPQGYAIAANGSDDILNIAVRAFSDTKMPAITLDPSYSLYPVLARMQRTKLIKVPFEKDMQIHFKKITSSKANIFFFTNPNAPTGLGFTAKVVEKFAKEFKGIVLVDEAYAPFADYSAAKLVEKYENLIVAGTSSKGWGLAGMRIGWAVANPKIIEVLDRVRDSYNLDRLAQVAGVVALADTAYYQKMRAKVIAEREACQSFFDELGWSYFKSSSNFILFTPKDKNGKSSAETAAALFEYLRSKKILLRYFPSEKSVNMSLRLTIGTSEQMLKFKKVVKSWLK